MLQAVPVPSTKLKDALEAVEVRALLAALQG